MRSDLYLVEDDGSRCFFRLFGVTKAGVYSFVNFNSTPTRVLSPISFSIIGSALRVCSSNGRGVSFCTLSSLDCKGMRGVYERLDVGIVTDDIVYAASRSFCCLNRAGEVCNFVGSGVSASCVSFPRSCQVLGSNLGRLLFRKRLEYSPGFSELICTTSQFNCLRILSPRRGKDLSLMGSCFIRRPVFESYSSRSVATVSLDHRGRDNFGSLSMASRLVFTLCDKHGTGRRHDCFTGRI